MKHKEFVSVLFFAAAAMAVNVAPSWGQSEGTKEKSVGGTQSERTGPGTETPSSKGSPSAGSTEPSKAGKGSASGTAQGSKDTSLGGTQRDRTGTSADTPRGSRSAGSSDPSKAGEGSRSASQGMGQQDVRQAQEALKNQGHDPGPIDGVMGPQTRQALREFQSKQGLKQTGNLDPETKQKLNMEGSSSGSSGSATGSRSGSGAMGKGESSSRQKEPSSSPMGK